MEYEKVAMKKFAFFIAASLLLVASCGTTTSLTRADQYPEMYEAKPVTLLVMAPINNTTNVEAKEYLYSSITRPLCEAGYYVISPMLALDILKAESAYDAELFTDKPLDKFQKYFGVDAVVFSEINSWEKTLSGISTNIRYFIRNAYTGEIIFDRTCDLYLDLTVNTGGNSLLSSLIDLTATAINTAATDHVAAARKANSYIFKDIPRGKYSADYQMDQGMPADDKNISITIK